MPFKSQKQLRFMFATHPDIAHRWAKEYPQETRQMATNKSFGNMLNEKKPKGVLKEEKPNMWGKMLKGVK